MARLQYGKDGDNGTTAPVTRPNKVFPLALLGSLSLMGTLMLVVGGLALFLGAETPLIVLERGKALAVAIGGGALDVLASLMFVKQVRARNGAARHDQGA